MKNLIVAALILPVALLGTSRSANAGDKAAAILTGLAVGVGAALVLDAIAPRPVVAAPAVVYPPAPVVIQTPPPVVVTPPPVVYYTPPPVVYYTPPPVVYQPAPVILQGPPHVVHPPHPAYYNHGRGKTYYAYSHGKRSWKARYKHHDDD